MFKNTTEIQIEFIVHKWYVYVIRISAELRSVEGAVLSRPAPS